MRRNDGRTEGRNDGRTEGWRGHNNTSINGSDLLSLSENFASLVSE